MILFQLSCKHTFLIRIESFTPFFNFFFNPSNEAMCDNSLIHGTDALVLADRLFLFSIMGPF